MLRSVILKSGSIEKPAVSLAPPHTSREAVIGVIPIADKYDASGKAVGDLPPDYRTHNSIFDGHRVRLTAAAGEVVGFELLLRSRQGKRDEKVSVKVQLDEVAPRIDLHQAVYVPTKAEAGGRLIPDPLLPMPDYISLESDADRSVVADLYIPFDAVPGLRTGKITISDGRVVPLEIQVLKFALPRQATFFCEMNGYGLPDHVNEYYALQQVAYDHRVHANILHYSDPAARDQGRVISICDFVPGGGWTIRNTTALNRVPRQDTGTILWKPRAVH